MLACGIGCVFGHVARFACHVASDREEIDLRRSRAGQMASEEGARSDQTVQGHREQQTRFPVGR